MASRLARPGAQVARRSRKNGIARQLLDAQQSSSPVLMVRRDFSDFLRPGSKGTGDGRLRLKFAGYCLPHPSKASTGGEDGYFACAETQTFGVADGVGGWAESGADPGEYSRAFLKLAHEEVRKVSDSEASCSLDLNAILQSAFRRLTDTKIDGGTTALLGHFHEDVLSVLNLGDSGVSILRPALRTPPGSQQPVLFPRMLFRSVDQTHYFNCPYQLASSSAVGELEPADLIRIQVRAGDVIVAATDGVFDNLHDRQLQGIVGGRIVEAWRQDQTAHVDVAAVAKEIVEKARKIGEQEDKEEVVTPFALSAYAEGIRYHGGKLDDTTAIVGVVVEDGEVVNGASGSGSLPAIQNFER
eukprot:TRINITY_DN28660_c0_g1_i1.p1 TRINITY_DN28660_c0_g1~~TRINITY_DN28660_c0_g1_i1.p1  ORF type:complete len:388 (-),score=82.85 TRINITY_DN28660_c0_g1_i1:166-1236(-)